MSTWGPELFDSDEDLSFQEEILERADVRSHAPGALRPALEASIEGLAAHALHSAPRESQVLLYLILTTGTAVAPGQFKELVAHALADPEYAQAKAFEALAQAERALAPSESIARHRKYLQERARVLDGLKALCNSYNPAGGTPMRLKHRSLKEFA